MEAVPWSASLTASLSIWAHASAVEDVVPQDHGTGVVADKFLPQQKGLGQARRERAGLIGQAESVLTAVSQQVLKIGQVLGVEMIRISRIPASIRVDRG